MPPKNAVVVSGADSILFFISQHAEKMHAHLRSIYRSIPIICLFINANNMPDFFKKNILPLFQEVKRKIPIHAKNHISGKSFFSRNFNIKIIIRAVMSKNLDSL